MEESIKFPVFAENLRRMRVSRDLTQNQMAEQAGVKYKSYQSWEEGRARPKPDDGAKIANFFGVSLSELYVQNIPPAKEPERVITDAVEELPPGEATPGIYQQIIVELIESSKSQRRISDALAESSRAQIKISEALLEERQLIRDTARGTIEAVNEVKKLAASLEEYHAEAQRQSEWTETFEELVIEQIANIRKVDIEDVAAEFDTGMRGDPIVFDKSKSPEKDNPRRTTVSDS